MANERNIGRIVTVDSLSVYVRLDDDLKSLLGCPVCRSKNALD